MRPFFREQGGSPVLIGVLPIFFLGMAIGDREVGGPPPVLTWKAGLGHSHTICLEGVF